MPKTTKTPPGANSAGSRVVAQIVDAIGVGVERDVRAAAQCRTAIAEEIDSYIQPLDEQQREDFFAALETGATAKRQASIASHPLRPASVQARVDKARAEAQAAKERAKAERAESKRQRNRELYEQLRREFGSTRRPAPQPSPMTAELPLE